MLPTCAKCGLPHDSLSFAIPASMPTALAEMHPASRSQRAKWDQDYCVIDDRRFFAYGSLSLPITSHPAPFIWGAWAEVSEEDFDLLLDLRGVPGRAEHGPISATLAIDIPFYQLSTMGLELNIILQPVGTRPEFAMVAGPHPLIEEQHAGVPSSHIIGIASWFQNLKNKGGPT